MKDTKLKLWRKISLLSTYKLTEKTVNFKKKILYSCDLI